MTNNGDSNDPGIPSAYHWGPEQIDQWITGLGFPQYRETFKANFITGKKLVLLDASRLSQVKYQFCLSKNSQVTKFGAKTSVRRLFDTTLSVLKFTVSSPTQVPRINVLLPSSNNSFLLEYFKRL